MALYEPLRDAFDDLNKMIVDSQQWDAQHAAREADNEYRHAVLKSNLQQRRFENDMAEQVMEIRMNGDQRAADAAERAILESNRNYEAQQDRFAFDKSKFVETQERNKLLNEHTALQIDELKKPSTPTRVDLNGLISPRLAKNARFMGELNEWAGARNMIVGDDLIGMSADADGNYIETLVSPNEQVKYAPFVRGLAAKYDNPIDNIKEDMVVLEEYRQELLKETTGKDNYNLKERAEARRKVNVIEAELASQKKELLNPETAKESYGRRAREMQGAADWLRLQGANDAADDYSTGAMKLLDNALAADKTSKGQRIQTWKPELTNNASVPGPSLVFNTVTEMYTGKYTDADGNIQEISVPQVSDLGLVTDEPTPLSNAERGIGTGGPRGLLSEKEMTNVKGYFEAEGIVAGLHSDAVRPKMQKMGTYIKKIHKMMGGGEDTRQEAKIMTIEKIQEFEAAYWDEVDAWKALSNKEKIQVWKASGHVVTKGKTKYQQMKDYYYNGNFNPAVRALLQDDKMMAYRPNETTRKQTKGTTR